MTDPRDTRRPEPARTSVPANFVVPAADTDRRLDVVVAEHLEESRSRAARRIEAGEVQVNGVVALKSLRLSPGDRVLVTPPPRGPSGGAGVPVPPIRYEDDHVLVVAKPAGLVVHPGSGRSSGTLAQVLEDAGYPLSALAGPERPGIVHRLDRDTSGLMVVAKTDEAYRGLTSALARREVDRTYLALVEGELGASRGRVDAPIGRDPRDRTRFAAVPDGKPAVTHWEVIDRGVVAGTEPPLPVSLVRCRLETGRTHQIRVHLAYAGHPVVGDRTYGARRDIAEALRLRRPFLHAVGLAFAHPVTGQRAELREELTSELRSALTRAGIDPG